MRTQPSGGSGRSAASQGRVICTAIGARHVVWIATANDASRIEPSLLSRFLVHTIGEPDADQRLKTARHLFRQLLREYDAPDLHLRVSEYAIEKVAQANRMRPANPS